MGSVFGRRRRRRYVRRHRSRRTSVVALLIGSGFALIISVTHLALARSSLEAELRSEPAGEATVHGLRQQSPLIKAFAAAFGTPYGVLKRVGVRQEATWFTPGVLVQASFGPVLISEGEVIAPDVDSTGKLAVVYLQGLRPRRIFLPAIESGSSGQIFDWRVRSDRGRYPVIEVEGRATLPDRSCAWTTLLELAPAGPRELSTISTLDAPVVGRTRPC